MKITTAAAWATSSTLLFSSLAGAGPIKTSPQHSTHLPWTVRDAIPFAPPAPLVKAAQSSAMKGRKRNSQRSRRRLEHLSIPAANHTTGVTKRYGGLDYSVEILWGKQKLDIQIDTGSSDLWVAQENFTCYNNGKPTFQSFCGFGEFLPSDAGFSGGGQIEGQNLNVGYGSGSVRGDIGFADITLAGVQVTKQEVGIAWEGYWDGDNVTAGIMGLAYPSITDAWEGRNFANDTSRNFRQYNPFLFNAFKRGLVPPMFSLALTRSEDDAPSGQMALGGLPDVEISNNSWVSVPIKVLRGTQDGGEATFGQYSFYAFDVDGWVVDGEFLPSDEANKVYIVDSGDSQMEIQKDTAQRINAKFSPNAKYSNSEGQYQIPCDGTAPTTVAIRIGGVDFPIDSKDLIEPAQAGYDPFLRGTCVSSVQIGGPNGGNFLGDPFLRNVVVVFDIGAAEMRFAPHKY